MTRKLLFIPIILVICLVSKSSAQLINLIHNAGMEDPSNTKSPRGQGMVDDRNFDFVGDGDCKNDGPFVGLAVWEDRLKDKKGSNDDIDGCKKRILLHSPEWFSHSVFDDGVGGLFTKFRVGTFTGTMQAQEGDAYIGIGTCELVQQKFFNATRFKQGEEYTLNMYIRPLSFPLVRSKIQGRFESSATATLKVYLRKTKMRYSIAANKKKNQCEPNYCEKKNFNNTIEILSIDIDLINFPSTSWHSITTTFTAPSDDFDWFVIENLAPNDMCNSYILIDNVTLARSCEFPSCDRTTGFVFPVSNLLVSQNTPFKIWNLNNVFSAKLEISSSISGASPFYTSPVINCTNGITDTIYWDGKNDAGVDMVAGQYFYGLTVLNECGLLEFDFKAMDKIDIQFTGTIPTPIGCNNSGVKTPKPCCTLEPDIYIDNVTLSGPGELVYKAVNNIFFATNGPVTITNNAEVILQAGNEIISGTDITVEPGSVVSADIVTCTGSCKTSNNNYGDNDNNDISNGSENIDMESEEVEDPDNIRNEIPDNIVFEGYHLNNYPNPFSEGTIIGAYVPGNFGHSEIIVYDIIGVVVKRFVLKSGHNFIEINAGDLEHGTYLYTLISAGYKIETKTMVHVK